MSQKSTAIVAVILAIFLSATVLGAAQRRNEDREAAAATQNLAPRPASQAEADAFNAINPMTGAAKLAAADKFLSAYPQSQLVGFAHRQRMQALIELQRFPDATAAGQAGLAAESQYIEAMIKRAEADSASTERRDRDAPPPLDKNSPAFQQFMADAQATYHFYNRALMTVALQMDDAAKAIEYGEQAYAIDPDDLGVVVTLSSTMAERPGTDEKQREANLKRAEEVGKKAVEMVTALVSGPQGAALPAAQKAGLLGTVHSTMGLVYLHQAKYSDSQKSYTAALSAKKDDAVAYYRLGLALGKQNPPKIADAMSAFAKSVFLKGPTEADARSILQDLYQQEKKSLDGLDQFIQSEGAKIGQ